jgi:hypothetical protein
MYNPFKDVSGAKLIAAVDDIVYLFVTFKVSELPKY